MRAQLIVAFAVPVALLTPASVVSQQTIAYPRADRLTTRVKATAVGLSGDTVRVTYTVYNDSTSVQDIESFVIRTTSTATANYGRPTNSPYWYIGTGKLQDSTAIDWFAAASTAQIAPGDSAAGFSHSAVGELDIARYHVRGYVPAPLYDDSRLDSVRSRLPFWQDSFRGWTIAVFPLGSMALRSFAERLVLVTDRACQKDVSFVTDATLCANPNSRPRLALRMIGYNNVPAACYHVRALINEVAALSDSGIMPEGRALLSIRAEHILRRHCAVKSIG